MVPEIELAQLVFIDGTAISQDFVFDDGDPNIPAIVTYFDDVKEEATVMVNLGGSTVLVTVPYHNLVLLQQDGTPQPTVWDIVHLALGIGQVTEASHSDEF